MVTAKQLQEAHGSPVRPVDFSQAIADAIALSSASAMAGFQRTLADIAANAMPDLATSLHYFVSSVALSSLASSQEMLASLGPSASMALNVSFKVIAEPSQSANTSQIHRHDTPQHSAEDLAYDAMTEFRAFYSGLADEYEQALTKADKARDRKLAFARSEGDARVAAIQSRLSVADERQLARLQRILTGLRQISASTTDVAGRGSLLVRTISELENRLTRWGLIQQVQPSTRVSVKRMGGNVGSHLPALAA